MEDHSHSPASSRSTSPEPSADSNSTSSSTSSLVASLPEPVQAFFQTVSKEGFPTEATKPKSQPWRVHWAGPQPPKDGRVMVACPKQCDYGSNSLGGY